MPRLILKTKNFMLLGISTFIFAMSNTSQAQNFYKWVDKNGSTHYTLTPPPSNAKKVSKVVTYSDHTTYVAPTSAPTNEVENSQQNMQNQQQNQNNDVETIRK